MRLLPPLVRVVLLFVCFQSVEAVGRAQTTIHVPSNEPTIQAGIDTASNGDTVLVAPGTYSENIDFKGKAITVTSGATSFSGAVGTIIVGSNGPTVIFQSNEPASAVLNGFTIEHIFTNSQSGFLPVPGEGIAIFKSSPTITNNVVTQNGGCGISVTLTPGTLIQGNDLRQNSSVFGPDPEGLSGCGPVFSEILALGINPLALGAGISTSSGTKVRIVSNTIEENNAVSANGCGGGIFATDTQSLWIENNVIRNNDASCSSGVFATSIGNLSIIQNLIYDNLSETQSGKGNAEGGGFGAGVTITVNQLPNPLGGSQTLVNNTIYGNKTREDDDPLGVPGDQLYIAYQPSQSYIENNIFDDTDGVAAVYCEYPAEFNFSYNDTLNAGTYIPQNCTPYGAGNISADPLFINAAGGNFHLPGNSPAVAAGNISAPSLPQTDLDGLSRTYNNTVDLGVYEYHPPTFDTTALTSSLNPSYVGQLVTFTATVTPVHPNGTLTGTIKFEDGANDLGTLNVNSAGVAALSTSSLTVGTHPISAIYSGDTNQLPSTSNTVSQVVTLIGTTTTLTSSGNPAAFGQNVTFMATVQSAIAGDTVPGSVNFYDGSTLLGSALLGSGSASYSTSTLAVGSHTITAQFIGGSTYSGSTSNAFQRSLLLTLALRSRPIRGPSSQARRLR